jgi:4-hydroxy-tetrahydrodipicolinate reductase
MRTAVAIQGASGRLGREIVALVLRDDSHWDLKAAIVGPSSKQLSQPLPSGAPGQVYRALGPDSLVGVQIAIDCSTPQAALAFAEDCVRSGVPLLVATTGFSPDEIRELHRCAEAIPLLLAPNTSKGVCVLRALAGAAARYLGSSFDVEVVEFHHRGKKDAPSGTAKLLVEDLQRAGRGAPVLGRGSGLRQEGEIGVASLRGGTMCGEHRIIFAGSNETLEITHRAENRSVFAEGALWLAAKLLNRPPGFYQLADMIDLESLS